MDVPCGCREIVPSLSCVSLYQWARIHQSCMKLLCCFHVTWGRLNFRSLVDSFGDFSLYNYSLCPTNTVTCMNQHLFHHPIFVLDNMFACVSLICVLQNFVHNNDHNFFFFLYIGYNFFFCYNLEFINGTIDSYTLLCFKNL